MGNCQFLQQNTSSGLSALVSPDGANRRQVGGNHNGT